MGGPDDDWKLGTEHKWRIAMCGESSSRYLIPCSALTGNSDRGAASG